MNDRRSNNTVPSVGGTNTQGAMVAGVDVEGFHVVALQGGCYLDKFYGEFDGRRRKRVLVKIIGE